MRKGRDGENEKWNGKKTSPPSAREAAMSAMQHETFLKHFESSLETSLKHSGNTPSKVFQIPILKLGIFVCFF